ncbi:MAG: CYTH domain-containing protein [Ignavibacteria bacterium]|nr:CYTH domain-containing protein [Ignavibacteria bacterium]
MPVNLELKLKVISHREIINKLNSINALFKKTLYQKDIYYSFPNGLLKLRVEGKNSFLIKYLRDEKGKRFSKYEILNLKGKQPENYLSEIFTVDAIVQKKRKLYSYNNTRIHLDEVKSLGKFIELETLVVKNRQLAQNEFREVIKLLDLNLADQIRTSYKNLILK